MLNDWFLKFGLKALPVFAGDDAAGMNMPMTYKAKDASMVRQIHQGEKVRVRVENVGGTLTIVKIVKVS